MRLMSAWFVSTLMTLPVRMARNGTGSSSCAAWRSAAAAASPARRAARREAARARVARCKSGSERRCVSVGVALPSGVSLLSSRGEGGGAALEGSVSSR